MYKYSIHSKIDRSKMSLKRDWNDISDQDTSSSDEQQEIQNRASFNKQTAKSSSIPPLNKMLSSPLPDRTFQKKKTNQQENLSKLESSTTPKIWLFIPNFDTNKSEEIDAIIKNQIEILKIDRFPKGWNVLVSRQTAKMYIKDGLREGEHSLKLFYSTKNQKQGRQKDQLFDKGSRQFKGKQQKQFKNHNKNRQYNESRVQQVVGGNQPQQKKKYMPKSSSNSRIPAGSNLNRNKSQRQNDDQRDDQKDVSLKRIQSEVNNNNGYKDTKNIDKNFNKNQKKFVSYQQKHHQRKDDLKNRDNDNRQYESSRGSQAQQDIASKSQSTLQKPKYVQKKDQKPTKYQVKQEQTEQRSEVKYKEKQVQYDQPDDQRDNEDCLSPVSPTKSKKKRNKKKKNELVRDSNNPYSELGSY